MDEHKRRAVETAFRRRKGASEAHAEKVKANMLSQNDLFTTCRFCGQTVRGTLDTLREHVARCERGD